MSRRFAAVSALVGCIAVVGSAGAHELKVFASRYLIPAEGGGSLIYLADGHVTPIDGLIAAEAVGRYDLVAPDGTRTPLKTEGTSLQTNEVELKAPGVHSVAVARTPAAVSITVDEEGGRDFKVGSKRDLAGVELDDTFHSEQYAKAMIVVGEPGDEAPAPAGLPVEILALEGPSRWTAGRDVRFRVVRDGEPVRFAPVVARHLGFKPDDAWSYATETDGAGEFSIRPDRAATWIIGVEFRCPAPAANLAEYDAEVFASTLTFEVSP